MSHTAAAGRADAMDRIYRYQRFIYDITRRYYLLGRNPMIAALAVPEAGTVLEVGCGTARNLILTAGRYPSARLYGFDISAEMLKTADSAVRAAGESERIQLARGDASRFDADAMFSIARFDRIYISYALSMIPDWPAIIERSIGHLAPGGALHIVDFGHMERMPRPCRRAIFSWLARFSVSPRRDLASTALSLANRNGLRCTFRHGRFDYWAHAVLQRD